MNHNDYIVIQAPMITELGLRGNRLIIYALIHGFCKDGFHEFNGSISYICEWTNLSRGTVISVLKSLVDDGLIEKHEKIINGVKTCSYCFRGSSKIEPPVQKLNQGSSKIEPNNNNNNNIDSNTILCNTIFGDTIKEKEKILKEKENSLFEQCWIAYRRKGRKKLAKEQWKKLSNEEKESVLPHIQVYVKTRELVYQADFERYLRNRDFQSIIVKDNIVLYDPNNETNNTYHPITGGSLTWNDYYKCYLYIGWYNAGDKMYDGYDDDKRPDGAKIVLNNGRGTLTWNKDNQQWLLKK